MQIIRNKVNPELPVGLYKTEVDEGNLVGRFKSFDVAVQCGQVLAEMDSNRYIASESTDVTFIPD